MKSRKSAGELLSELRSDADFLAREQEKKKAKKELEAELAAAESDLVSELQLAGLDVQSVWDLVNRGDGYESAIDILFKHVRRNYPDRIREGILRALAVPEAKKYWDDLLDFYEHNSLQLSNELRYLSSVVLSGAADDDVIEDVMRLVRDRTRGFDRAPLLFVLQRSCNSEAKMLLHELRGDPVLGKEIKRMRRHKRLQKSKDSEDN